MIIPSSPSRAAEVKLGNIKRFKKNEMNVLPNVDNSNLQKPFPEHELKRTSKLRVMAHILQIQFEKCS